MVTATAGPYAQTISMTAVAPAQAPRSRRSDLTRENPCRPVPGSSEHSPLRARRAGVAALAALTAGLAAAAPASAINYVTSGNGASWSVADSAAPGSTPGVAATPPATEGAVYGFGGIRVAVDSAPAPRFNGELMRGFGLRFDGVDGFETRGAVQLGDVRISRDLPVGRGGNSRARFLDTFSNTGREPVTSTSPSAARSARPPRGNSQSAVVRTSSGDAVIATDDSWVTVATPTPGYSATRPRRSCSARRRRSAASSAPATSSATRS